MAICHFKRINDQTIRCTVCGKEQRYVGRSEKYIRGCGDASAGTNSLPIPPTNRCIHRGDVIETGVCNVCGMKGQPFEIRACELHGRCMERRYRNDRPGIQVCMQCKDYQSEEARA
jgi:hypothetical protein